MLDQSVVAFVGWKGNRRKICWYGALEDGGGEEARVWVGICCGIFLGSINLA